MTILSHFRPLAILVLLLFSGMASADEGREDAAVLYAHDGETLFHVNPHKGTLTEIGALDIHFARFGSPTYYGSMTYDAKQHKLYAYAPYAVDGGAANGAMIVEIDPHTVALRMVIDSPNAVPLINLSYDWRTGQLVDAAADPNTLTTIYAMDPENGQQTMINRGEAIGIGGFALQVTFFDPHGFLWLWAAEDSARFVRKYDLSVPDGRLVYRLDGQVEEPGIARSTDWPRYRSFSFNPYTGVLYATFTPLFQDAKGDFPVTLCTVDLKTFQPSKIIATYDKPGAGFWNLEIAWGFSR